MEGRIIPDKAHPLNIGGDKTNIRLDGAFETLHYYAPLDASWIRYYDEEEGKMRLIVVSEDTADTIVEQTDIPIVYRESIFESEHKTVTGVLGKWICDDMFNLDIDEQAIVEEEQED